MTTATVSGSSQASGPAIRMAAWLFLAAACGFAQSVNLTVSNIPPSARRVVVIADGSAVTGPVYARRDIALGTGSVNLDVGLPAGVYRLRALADGAHRALQGAGQTTVTLPESGTTTASIALANVTASVDPGTPAAAPGGSPVTIRMNIADSGDVVEAAGAYLYVGTAPFNLVIGGVYAGAVRLAESSPGYYSAAFAVNTPASGPFFYYAMRVQIATGADPSLLYSPDPNVAPGLPWEMRVFSGSTLNLTVSFIPATATRLVVIADGGALPAPLYARWSLAPGTYSTTVAVGLPAGTFRVRALVDGVNRAILRTGQTAATVPAEGSGTASIALSNLFVSVDPSTPAAALAGSTVAIRFDLADAGDVLESGYAYLFGGDAPFNLITGGTYLGARAVAKTGPGVYTATISANVPTANAVFYYALRVQVPTGAEYATAFSPDPNTFSNPWQMDSVVVSAVDLTVSGIPPAAGRLVVVADGPAVSGPVYTRQSLAPDTASTTLTIGLPPGAYRLRALADGASRALLSSGQVSVVVPGSGAVAASIALADVSALLDPTTPAAAPAGSTVTIRLGVTDPGDVLEAAAAYLYTAPSAFNLVTGGAFSAAQLFARTAPGRYTVQLLTNLPTTAGAVLYYAIRAQLPTGGDYSMLYSPDPNAAPALPWRMAAGISCTYVLSPSSVSLAPAGGSGSITVTASSSLCPWNAQSTASWLALSSVSPGSGSGTLGFTAGANAGTEDRAASILVADQTVAVSQAGSAPGALRFIPVTPCRVADTRWPAGVFGGPRMAAATTRDFPVLQSSCGIPSTARAYSLNVTVVPSGMLGYLSIWPAGLPWPVVSTLNSYDGRIKANAAIVPAGGNGAISVFVTDATEVILDINGYFVPATQPGGLVFYPLTPCRVLDTTWPAGPLGGPSLGLGQARDVPVLASACGAPSGASAYSLNVTAMPKGLLGYITAWQTGAPRPLASTLNALTGAITANAAIVPTGTGGAISVYASEATDLAIDLNGYFAPPAAGGLSFHALTPCRVVDTRNPAGPFGGPSLLGQRTFDIVAGPCPVEASSAAYSLNATVVPPGALSSLMVWPAGIPRPAASTLSDLDGTVVSDAVLVGAPAGRISVYASQRTDLIIDINGYFGP